MGVQTTWTSWDCIRNSVILIFIMPMTATSDVGVFVQAKDPSNASVALSGLYYDPVLDSVRDSPVKRDPGPICNNGNRETTHTTPGKRERMKEEEVVWDGLPYDPVKDIAQDSPAKSESGPIYNLRNIETTRTTPWKRRRTEKEEA